MTSWEILILQALDPLGDTTLAVAIITGLLALVSTAITIVARTCGEKDHPYYRVWKNIRAWMYPIFIVFVTIQIFLPDEASYGAMIWEDLTEEERKALSPQEQNLLRNLCILYWNTELERVLSDHVKK